MSGTTDTGWSSWASARNRRFRTYRINGQIRVYQWDGEGGQFTDPQNRPITAQQAQSYMTTPRSQQSVGPNNLYFNRYQSGNNNSGDQPTYEVRNHPGAIFPRGGTSSQTAGSIQPSIQYSPPGQYSVTDTYSENVLTSGNQSSAQGSGGFESVSRTILNDPSNVSGQELSSGQPGRLEATQNLGSGRNSRRNVRTVADETADRVEPFATPIRTSQVNSVNTFNEQLDDRYWVRASSFFRTGRVFAMQWHESRGKNPRYTENGTELSSLVQTGAQFLGRSVYSTIRRMVVVKQKANSGHALCVPILTYRNRGCLKSGLKRREIRNHAPVFMHGTKEKVDREETRRGMTHRSIRIQPARADQKLRPMSRINFDKPYTVEHNIEVMDVGMVDPEDIVDLITYFEDALDGEDDE